MSKEGLMEKLVKEIQVCQRCRLWADAQNPVPGEGDLNADLMFIGEAPGYYEDVEGRPFVGAAGKLLNELIATLGLKREEVYIGNIVKHRPPKNRNPRKDEVAACGIHLDKQIQIIKPLAIITLGRHATQYILSKENIRVKKMGDVRGQVFTINIANNTLSVIPTYHPAAILYNPYLKAEILHDFKQIKRILYPTSIDG